MTKSSRWDGEEDADAVTAGGDAGHQIAGAFAAEVFEREALQVFVGGGAQVGADALADQREDVGVRPIEQPGEEGGADQAAEQQRDLAGIDGHAVLKRDQHIVHERHGQIGRHQGGASGEQGSATKPAEQRGECRVLRNATAGTRSMREGGAWTVFGAGRAAIMPSGGIGVSQIGQIVIRGRRHRAVFRPVRRSARETGSASGAVRSPGPRCAANGRAGGYRPAGPKCPRPRGRDAPGPSRGGSPSPPVGIARGLGEQAAVRQNHHAAVKAELHVEIEFKTGDHGVARANKVAISLRRAMGTGTDGGRLI